VQLQLDPAGLAWSCASPTASAFDIVRGDLAILATSGLTASTGACVADDHPTTNLAVADPAPGEARWYLVREAGGSYGSGGAAEQPGRDAALAASPDSCP